MNKKEKISKRIARSLQNNHPYHDDKPDVRSMQFPEPDKMVIPNLEEFNSTINRYFEATKMKIIERVLREHSDEIRSHMMDEAEKMSMRLEHICGNQVKLTVIFK